MFTRTLQHEKSSIRKRVKHFGLSLRDSPISFSKANKLFFLCGGTRKHDLPSRRREAIKNFIQGLSPEYTVIYAEGVFSELLSLGHKKNILDLEHVISDIADRILIVLESESAFCELGAFAHATFRKKLIIVNDERFLQSKSFINLGPIYAAKEANAPVLWYPMGEGVEELDGIGRIFTKLEATLQESSKHPTPKKYDKWENFKSDKDSLYFVHDMVLLTGPISYGELIKIFELLYGSQRFDLLKDLLAVLRASKLIERFEVNNVAIFRALTPTPLFNYHPGFNWQAMMAAFRSYHFQTQPKRFEHAKPNR